MSALSDLLTQRVVAQKISVREIARRAQGRGHTLSHGTVSKYLTGKHPQVPAEDTLRAFHEVLGISMRELREAANLPVGVPGPYEPPKEADRLDLEQRDAVDQIIRLLARKQVTGNAQHPAPRYENDGDSPPEWSAVITESETPDWLPAESASQDTARGRGRRGRGGQEPPAGP